MTRPTFLLGVGAQKSGTTWLWNAINQQSFSNMGFTKEYHIWDARSSELGKQFKLNEQSLNTPQQKTRLEMQRSPQAYVKYFKSLVNEEKTLTGDITPAYAFLDENTFREIRELLEKAAFEIRVIFLMRDPIERIWSAERMRQRNSLGSETPITNRRLRENFRNALKDPGSAARTNYKSTITTLENVFSKEQIHFEIYEDLFNEISMANLIAFLGYENDIAFDFERKFNSSNYSRISFFHRKRAMKALKEQYEFCGDRFPKTLDLWGSN